MFTNRSPTHEHGCEVGARWVRSGGASEPMCARTLERAAAVRGVVVVADSLQQVLHLRRVETVINRTAHYASLGEVRVMALHLRHTLHV